MNQTVYPPAIADLLRDERLQPLGPGSPNRNVYDRLRALTPEEALAPQPVADRDMAHACVAGLWLYHDFMDESHEISQELHTTTGSYWHGLMHRREPDFSNSGYWFRRVGNHPVFAELHPAAADLARQEKDLDGAAGFLLSQPRWDPFAFIDLCEAAYRQRNPCEMLCRRIQQREWALLFDYCYRQAIGE